jgi:hypothetical protein
LEFESLQTFKDRHKGRPAVVVGGGSSLLYQDGRDYEGQVMIGVNHALWLSLFCRWPMFDYWLAYDIPIIRWIDLDDFPATMKICVGNVSVHYEKAGFTLGGDGRWKNIIPVAETNHNLEPYPYKRDNEKFRIDGTVLDCAVQLAWVMGCNPITVRGLDYGPDESGCYHWFDTVQKLPSHGDESLYRACYTHFRTVMRNCFAAVRGAGVEVYDA